MTIVYFGQLALVESKKPRVCVACPEMIPIGQPSYMLRNHTKSGKLHYFYIHYVCFFDYTAKALKSRKHQEEIKAAKPHDRKPRVAASYDPVRQHLMNRHSYLLRKLIKTEDKAIIPEIVKIQQEVWKYDRKLGKKNPGVNSDHSFRRSEEDIRTLNRILGREYE